MPFIQTCIFLNKKRNIIFYFQGLWFILRHLAKNTLWEAVELTKRLITGMLYLFVVEMILYITPFLYLVETF